MKRILLPLILITSLFSILSCAQPAQESVVYVKITAEEAREMIENENVVILDVRTQEEFNEGHIPNAILLPSFEVQASAQYVIPDKDQIIIVYCQRGRRSEESARVLIELGYTRVYDIGGIVDWDGEVVTN